VSYLRNGRYGRAITSIMENDHGKVAFEEKVTKIVKGEVNIELVQYNETLASHCAMFQMKNMRSSTLGDAFQKTSLGAFSWTQVVNDAFEQMPFLLLILKAAMPSLDVLAAQEKKGRILKRLII
jgi:hypothetical protein